MLDCSWQLAADHVLAVSGYVHSVVLLPCSQVTTRHAWLSEELQRSQPRIRSHERGFMCVCVVPVLLEMTRACSKITGFVEISWFRCHSHL